MQNGGAVARANALHLAVEDLLKLGGIRDGGQSAVGLSHILRLAALLALIHFEGVGVVLGQCLEIFVGI